NSSSLWEVSAEGTHLHALLPGWSNPPAECCGNWTADGKYYVFAALHGNVANIWALAEAAGLFGRASREPVQLTSERRAFRHRSLAATARNSSSWGVRRAVNSWRTT